MNERANGDWNWNVPGEAGRGEDRRAAIMLWVAGGLQTVMFGVCSMRVMILGLMSRGQLRAMVAKSPQQSPQLDQLVNHHDAILPIAIVMMVLLVVPALWLIWLGFRVRQGRPLANVTARVILYAQSFLAAMMIFVSFLTGNIGAILTSLIVFGSLLGVLIATARACLLARDSKQTRPSADPWNQ